MTWTRLPSPTEIALSATSVKVQLLTRASLPLTSTPSPRPFSKTQPITVPVMKSPSKASESQSVKVTPSSHTGALNTFSASSPRAPSKWQFTMVTGEP